MTHGQVEDGHGLELPVPFLLGFKALGMARAPGSRVQHCQLAFLPALATREHLEQVNTTWDTAILSSRSLKALVAKSQPGSVLWLQAQTWLSSQAQSA